MSFAFIPRAVKKKNHPPVSSHTTSQITSESTCVDNPRETENPASSSESIKNKPGIADDDERASKAVVDTASLAAQKALFDLEDLAQLVCLALSDYAIWADVDLRRKIDWGNTQDNDTDLTSDTPIDDNNGYIPLAYLLRHSQVFRLVSSSSSIISQPPTTFIKAIRTHASHLIDVRLIIPSSSSATFSRNNTAQWPIPHIPSGYELRRKQVSSTLINHGKKEWDALTVYLENIPNHYRSIPGIIKFLNGLLPLSSSSIPRIQNMSLPSHHQDLPDSIPTCKGFALVTLSHDEDVNALLTVWSWTHPTNAMNPDRSDIKSASANTKSKGKEKDPPKISPLYLEAAKFGLRVLTKAKWEELRAEYLLYGQELVDEINTFQDEGEVMIDGGSGRKRGNTDETHDREAPITENAIAASYPVVGIHSNSAYPPGCLVFVRNVHPETNKTSLRGLFLHAWVKDDDGLDYLDYTKGMDSCYVRLRTPLHAQQLVHHFSSNPIVQTSGLDASGASFVHLSDKDDLQSKPILAEQVLGKREEVYWEKVPEKIRRQAVEKALSGSSCDVVGAPIASSSEDDVTRKKRELEGHQAHLVDNSYHIHADSAYPPGCLVFIRNVHPETNKTTLRNLFLRAREERMENGDSSGKKDEDGIDYLDYTKNMDCCHIRLRTPLHVQQLVHDLASNPIAQTTGLDASGSRLAQPSTSSSDSCTKTNVVSPSQLKPIVAEQVLGKREEVYWEKVPEKVRRQAVERALSFLHGGGECASKADVSEGNNNKPKKRRKK